MGGFDLIIKQDTEEIEAVEVFVCGTIGGHKYQFLLDTGAVVTSVRFDDYTSGFDCVGKKASSGSFMRCTDDSVTVPSIELGPISKRNFALARIGKGNPDEIRNLIGMDLLKNYCCHFFFDEHRVTIEAQDALERDYTFQELRLDKAFHPYIDIQFGELKAKAVWDTGAGITVVDIDFIREHSEFFQEVGYATDGTDSTGATRKIPMFSMLATVIGGYEFPAHRVAGVDLSLINATAEMPMDLVLGYSTLSRANWLFDFPRKKWVVSKRLFIR